MESKEGGLEGEREMVITQERGGEVGMSHDLCSDAMAFLSCIRSFESFRHSNDVVG